MNWQKPTRFAQLSEDGRYSVAKIGNEVGHFYEAYRTRQHVDGPHLISTCLKTPDEARAQCEADDE